MNIFFASNFFSTIGRKLSFFFSGICSITAESSSNAYIEKSFAF